MTAEPSGVSPGPSGFESSARVRLGVTEAAVFETFVVPRYMSLYARLALDMLAECQDAQVVHLNCRTGYPDAEIVSRLRGAYLVGVDASMAAVELARAKAATMPEMISQYHVVEGLPTSLPGSAFSHAIELHGLAHPLERVRVVRECARLLAVHGQALLAMPMRGSFQELADLLREYALKHDVPSMGHAVDQAMAARPTVEVLATELEYAGFDFVDVSLRPTTLAFRNARDFFEDPVARLLILPELRAELGVEEGDASLAYVREAIDHYWSDADFELTVNVGCVTARRER